MEYKYDRQLHNKRYYEKNKIMLREKARQKRLKMKEALQQVEAENQETEHEPKPEPMSSNFFEHFRYCKKYAIQSSHQWVTGWISSCIQSIKEDHREQAERYAVCACDFLKSVRLTMIINNIANGLNIIQFFIMIYNIYNG